MPYKDPYKNTEDYQKTEMVCTARERAKKKNLETNIDTAYIKRIWPKDNKCPALGTKFKRGKKDTGPVDTSPSLDRIIPERGYVKGNVQIISNLANKIKNNATPDQVLSVGNYLKKILENNNEETV